MCSMAILITSSSFAYLGKVVKMLSPLFFVGFAEICLDGEQWNDGLLATIRERV